MVEAQYLKIMNYIVRLWFTLQPLKFEQIFYRIYYKYFPLKVILETKDATCKPWLWNGPEVLLSSMLSSSRVHYLNLEADIGNSLIWNDSSFEKLWLYNLHYFDDLNAIDNIERTKCQLLLVKRWITENPPVIGNGWEPYPLSLRIVNLVKWYNRVGIKDDEIVKSIMSQTLALSKQLEYHILGNHLFANAKALIFAGCFLKGIDGERYLSLGLKLLDREIREQFLGDGGHFELSPMYHCIILWDLLDVINLAEIVNNSLLISRQSYWRSIAEKGLYWLSVMVHPDGEISFFNDATMGVAAKPSELFDYAIRLGIEYLHVTKNLMVLQDTGYSRIQYPLYTMLVDHAEVGASYLAGHGHADTLSFELSVGKQRVFVNSGTSVYGMSKERLRQRMTGAHNTLEVDGLSSSDVWSGFRVGHRAKIKLLQAYEGGGKVLVAAEHYGYSRGLKKIIHQRTITATNSSINILDRVVGNPKLVTSSLHLHPTVNVHFKSNFSVMLEIQGYEIEVRGDSEISVLDSTWHPEFGLSLKSKKLMFNTCLDNCVIILIKGK